MSASATNRSATPVLNLKAAALTTEFETQACDQLKPAQLGAAANPDYPTLSAPYRKEIKARERQQEAARCPRPGAAGCNLHNLHSALIPNSLMSGHHFSASAFTRAASASGVCWSRGKFPIQDQRDATAPPDRPVLPRLLR